jgi:hypothetical protein
VRDVLFENSSPYFMVLGGAIHPSKGIVTAKQQKNSCQNKNFFHSITSSCVIR